MSTIDVTASGAVNAPAEMTYGFLRNYRDHHPNILPGEFKEFTVEEGGVGAGTVFELKVSVYGKLVSMRMRVDEPEPGRVLRETELDGSMLTTFTVETSGDDRCTVTIDTTYETGSGINALVDRYIKKSFLRGLYEKELANLDVYARAHQKPATA